MRLRGLYGLVLFVACGAACNAITGVGDLKFDEATGGAGGTSGTGGSSGGATQGGGGGHKCDPKTVLFADPCWTCGKQKCCKELDECETDQQCTTCFQTSQCASPPPPTVYNLYYCLAQSCADDCSFGQAGAAGAAGSATGTGGAAADDSACWSMASKDCAQCCATHHPVGTQEYVKDVKACACATQGGECATRCPTACVTLTPDSTDCETCLLQCAGPSCAMSKPCTEVYNCWAKCPQ